jgi:GntR family transcriptional regulator
MDPDENLTRPEGLYQQVAHRLRQSIHDGRYRPGDQLPSEATISEQFGVSRQTVRGAISLLRSEGLIEVQQGRGSFVRTAPIRFPLRRYAGTARMPDAGPFEATCRALGIPGYGELVIVERRAASDEVAAGLGISVGAQFVYRRRYMHAGEPDAIIQIQEGHLPLDIVEGSPLAGIEKVTQGTYGALETIGHVPVRVTEEVTARMPTYSEATVLRLKSGVPVIQITRSTYDAGSRVVEWLVVTAAADRNVFVYEDLPLT